jgi:hypothetical protein
MKGDFTRSSFERTKNYSSVRLQQGRVLTDADCNEAEDIGLARERQLAADVIGHAAGPAGATGFEISLGSQNPRELMLSAGRYYVQGLLCELHEATPLSSQPALAGVDPTRNLPIGQYLLYLQAFERHVTHIDDASIKEVALGGPDTSTRLQVVAQARLKRLGARPAPTVCEVMSDSDTLATWIEGRRGRMAASVDPAPPVVDPCLVPSTAGYRGLENQLYRVEIHRGSQGGMATFKWSRDNASIAAEWTRHPNPDQVEVADFGPAGRGLNEPGVLVELHDSGNELTHRPGTLATVEKADEASRILTLKEPRDEEGNAAPIERGRDELRPRVRRWEGTEARRVDAADTDDGWIDLEQGVRIRFEHANRSFRTGDYWLIPARTVEGAITWDPAGLQEPHGIQQRYACLAVLERGQDDGPFTLQRRCQRQFPSVRELIHLRYVGGDGQRGRLGELLTYPLRVQVLNGGVPVSGAAVRFEVVDASGVSDAVLNDLPATTSGASLTLRTGVDGTVGVGWTLASEAAWTQAPQLSAQQVRATLLDECGEGTPQSVEFTASESSATLHYRGGTGQAAHYGVKLPVPLSVRVANGGRAVAGAHVQFKLVSLSDAGEIGPRVTGTLEYEGDGLVSVGTWGDVEGNPTRTITVASGPNGLAQVEWVYATIPGTGIPGVRAVLLAPNGTDETTSIVRFGAVLEETQPQDQKLTVITALSWRHNGRGLPLARVTLLDETPHAALVFQFSNKVRLVDGDDTTIRGVGAHRVLEVLATHYPAEGTDGTEAMECRCSLRGKVVPLKEEDVVVDDGLLRNRGGYEEMPLGDASLPLGGAESTLWAFVFTPVSRAAALRSNDILIRLRGDFVLSGVAAAPTALDANFIRGRLPTGDGIEGGTFESWLWLD